ncbi:MAG: carbohydrate kinase family protein [bacterium]|nr:carbohydrate kinase family protein [bacterium]
MYDIITIGSATQDVFLTSKDYVLVPSKKFSTGVGECFAFGSKIEVKNIFLDTGGGGTNTAATFAHLGFKTACLARVGDDAPGREIRSVLRTHGVATELMITTKKEHTAYSSILLTAMGERTVLVYRGASAHFSAREMPWKKMQTRWLHISSLGGNIALLKKIFAFAKKEGIAIAWNPGGAELAYGYKTLKPLIAATRIFILNREEAEGLIGFQTSTSKGIVVITDGKRGAYVYDGSHSFFSPSTGHKAVNTTGAGDAFGSAFVAGIMKGMTPTDALRLGILNSGLVVTKMGAKNGILKKMPLQSVLHNIRVRSF